MIFNSQRHESLASLAGSSLSAAFSASISCSWMLSRILRQWFSTRWFRPVRPLGLCKVIPVDWKTGMGSWKLCNSAGHALARRLLQDHQIPYAVCCMLKGLVVVVVCGLWFWLRGLVYYISIFFFVLDFFLIFGFELLCFSLLCFSAFLLFPACELLCFFAFLLYLLLCLSASPLFCLFVHAFLLFQLLCFLVCPASLLTCFSANLFFRLLCFSIFFWFLIL